MKKRLSLSTIDEDFISIEKLLKTLRKRIADVAEGVRLAALSGSRRRVSRKRKGRKRR